jgi:hypothetical protein
MGPIPSGEAHRLLEIERARHHAKEYRRRLMQGLGRPIISFEDRHYRFVTVGSLLYRSDKWLTFHDFLFDFIRTVFTPEWGNAELKKDLALRHPIMQWYQKLCDFQKAHAVKHGKVYAGEMTGSVKAYLWLAYDLYLCAHNALLPPLLVKRLKNPRTFEGALYETFVIGIFAKAGFGIAMEDEDDGSNAHCEFVATHQETGRKFSVEAKAVTSGSKRAGATPEPPRVREKIYRALAKDLPHERVIFIELNRTQTLSAAGVPNWVPQVDAEILDAEKTLTISGAPAPPAYIFVTNRVYLHTPDAPAVLDMALATGFKIADFASRTPKPILELVEARERHIELHWLMEAMQNHGQIPSTFDDKTPQEAFHNLTASTRLQIGQVQLFSNHDGETVSGVLADGIVSLAHRKAYGAFNLTNGTSVLVQKELSDDDIALYNGSPDTYFGVVKPVSVIGTKPLQTFDFFYNAFKDTPREALLQLMLQWSCPEDIGQLSQEKLVRLYSAAAAASLLNRGQAVEPARPPTDREKYIGDY